MQQLAYEEGARLYQLALDALAAAPALEQAESCGLMVELGEALSRAGYFDRAREVFARAAALARKSNDSGALARAALGVGIPSSRAGTVDGMLVELLEEALRTSGEVRQRAEGDADRAAGGCALLVGPARAIGRAVAECGRDGATARQSVGADLRAMHVALLVVGT